MKKNKQLYSMVFILFLFILSFTSSLAIAQAASNSKSFAYITNDDRTVSVIDTAKDTVTAKVTNLGNDSYGLTVIGTKVYVADLVDNEVSVIDTATNTVTTTVPVGHVPYGVAATETKVYVANSWDNTVSVIDTATNNVTTTVPVGSKPFGVAVTPDGTKVYITNSGDNTISIINAATNQVTDTVNVMSNNRVGLLPTPSSRNRT